MTRKDSEEQVQLYFAYGSNLSTTQMRDRCPRSTPIGLAHLSNWTWIINERGYANIVPKKYQEPSQIIPSTRGTWHETEANDGYHPSLDQRPQSAPEPGVYGLVYRLHPDDERQLDYYEGVGFAYDRQMLEVVWATSDALPGTEPTQPTPGMGRQPDKEPRTRPKSEKVQALAYVDSTRINPSTPKEEYVGRMNVGIEEARLPAAYVDEVIRPYIRPYIPAPSN